jgi:hypothetical protein
VLWFADSINCLIDPLWFQNEVAIFFLFESNVTCLLARVNMAEK